MNGSIFPYRHATGKTESASTNLRVRAHVSFGSRMPWPVGTVTVVGQRGSDAEGVAGRGGGLPWSSTQPVPQANPWGAWARCDDGRRWARYPVIPAAEKSFGVRRRAAVPQTDTGGQVENTKAIERILVKELGKSLPFLRFKGDPRW